MAPETTNELPPPQGFPPPIFSREKPWEEVASGPARHCERFIGDAWVRVRLFWMYLRGYVSFGLIGYSWACTNMTWSLSLSHRWLIYPEIRSKLKKKVYYHTVKFTFLLLHIISSFRLRLFTWKGYPFPKDLVEFHQADCVLVWSLPAPIVYCLQGNNHVTNSLLPAFEENGIKQQVYCVMLLKKIKIRFSYLPNISTAQKLTMHEVSYKFIAVIIQCL